MTTPDPTLERWRLILGTTASMGSSPDQDVAARDAALDWPYGRDEELRRRGIRRRGGGSGDSVLTTPDWLDDIHRLFPKETIERLERDAGVPNLERHKRLAKKAERAKLEQLEREVGERLTETGA